MRISDWSSDVCSSDLGRRPAPYLRLSDRHDGGHPSRRAEGRGVAIRHRLCGLWHKCTGTGLERLCECRRKGKDGRHSHNRSEEHTSELQSLMRISYAVFCLKKKKTKTKRITNQSNNSTTKTIQTDIKIT